MLQTVRLEIIIKSLECGQIESGSRLNQEMGLPRPGETRWGQALITKLYATSLLCIL